MTTRTVQENITLYFREGSSDKIYQIGMQSCRDGFVVNFAYGRRGSTLTTGTKTAHPVSYDQAKKTFDKLVKEKTAKGYTPGEDGTRYQHTDKADRVSGILPQLLNPIDESEVERYLCSDDHWMQEKFDGRRVLIIKHGAEVTGINRSGLTTDLPESIVEAIGLLGAKDCLLDGEAVDGVYHVFDLLQKEGMDLTASRYAVRWGAMIDLVDGVQADALRYAESAFTTSQKRSMLEKFRQAKKEGVVFKDRTAPYTLGRPASGGPQLKLKFYATASCIVAGVNGNKRSVSLELISGNARVGVGSVTIPPNHPIPEPGSVVEARYLYALRGGSLYQSVYLGVRDDLPLSACTIAQLKFKAESPDPDN